jgi:hypothetical protein
VTTDSPPAPEGEPSLPDDVWERFLQDSERDIRASAPKEPSARARIVARRLREEDERAAAAAARRRFGRRGRDGYGSAARRSGPAGAARRTGRRRMRSLLWVLLVVAVVLFLLSPSRSWSFVTGNGWRAHSAGSVPTRVIPTSASTASTAGLNAALADPEPPTLGRPFA